jgi:hypothetical protein
MTMDKARWVTMRIVLAGAIAAAPATAWAQAVGIGPLTRTLTATEPTTGVLDWGRVKLAPGFVIDELGYDPNVFDENIDPKSDWVFRGTADLAVFTGLRFMRFSGYVGSDMGYYHKYYGERFIKGEYRGRVDFLLGLLQPFVQGGETGSRSRPNGEIDVRPNRKEREYGGGIAYNFGAFQSIYAAATVYEDRFENAVEDGIPLSLTLDRNHENYSAGVRTALTPLAQLTVFAAIQKDRFKYLPLRNTERQIGTVALQIGAEAALSGNVSLSYQDFRPVDPGIRRYRGVASEVAVTYPFLEIGRLSVGYRRGLEYSFDADEAYYMENTGNLSYTHRLFGEVDVQVRGAMSFYDYGFAATSPARRDTNQIAGASVGYNVRNRTRIALNYEDARRRSPVFPERNFDRKRVYLSWGYAF